MGMLDDMLQAIDTINTQYQRRFGGTPAAPPSMGDTLDHAWHNANNGETFPIKVEYAVPPWQTVERGQQVLAEHLARIRQVGDDLRDNARCEACHNTCSTTCTSSCVNGCSGCTGGCSGGCGSNCDGSQSHYNCSGCFTWCSGCSGACQGCEGGCRGGCARDCGGGCSNKCRSGCTGDCRNGCSASCTSDCSNSARMGAVL